jgi:catecholate siderophore receptor
LGHASDTAFQPGVRASARHALTAAIFASAAGLALAPGAYAADDATGAASAATAPADDQSAGTSLTGVEVTGVRQTADSPKYTAALVDTPQTITVISKEVIQAQNLLTLRDILSTVPGITFGAGEGGSGYGDSINLRGYSASSDITIDGVRDSAQYTRSDPFDTEQIEVTNGADGVYTGSGSVGGNINIVSKAPLAHNSTSVTVGGGTDGYARATLDSNVLLTPTIAVRLNAMVHENDVPGRDVEDYHRWGVAPSVTFGVGTDTQDTVSYFYQLDANVPQYGIPYVLSSVVNGVVPGASRSAYYGFANVDRQDDNVNDLTNVFSHQFGANLSLKNLTRYEIVNQFSVVDQPQGGFCLADGVWANTYSGVSTVNTPCSAPNTFSRSVSGTYRDTQNTELYNQTDFIWTGNTGFIQHNAVLGVSLLHEGFTLNNGSSLRTTAGAAPALSTLVTSLTHPNDIYTGPLNLIQGGGALATVAATATTPAYTTFPAGSQTGTRDNQAIYLFDDAKLNPQWSFNFGLRYEHNAGANSSGYYTVAGYLPNVGGGTLPGVQSAGAPAGVYSGQGPVGHNENDLFSYRAGLVFKPTESSSIYVAYGNSKTPSQASVNGSCVATTATTTAAGTATCDVAPETAINYEAGIKWNVANIALTASIFRNDRTNYKVPSDDPTLPAQVLDGQARVQGVALGASGKVTNKLSLFANYTYLDSTVLRGESALCVTSPATAVGCPTPATNPTGRPLTATPKNAASLWATYDLTQQWQVGYGLTYQSSIVVSNTLETPTGGLYTAPGYTVSRASVTWRFKHDCDLRLNVNNLFDTKYLTNIRTSANGWAEPGAARSATLTLDYRF